MENKDDQTLEGGAGEAIEPTEPQAPATPPEPQAPVEPQKPLEPTGDPLDDIRDQVARDQAKAARAIARRSRDTQPVTAPLQPTQTATPLATDKTIEFLAKKEVSDEVREHWDELLAIPLGGYNPHDPASIAENMTLRLATYKAMPQKTNPNRDLVAETGQRGRSGGVPTTEKKSIISRPLDVDAQAAKLYG